MPPLETSDLLQNCVVWEWVRNDRSGNPVVKSGRDVDCRWVYRRAQSVNANGEPIGLDAKVALAEEVPDGSIFWLGYLKDFEDDGTNRLLTNVTFGSTPDLKARENRFEYGLMKFKAKLPTVDPDA